MFRSILITLLIVAVFALTSANPRVKRGLYEDAERILKQSGVEPNNVGQLLDLIERNNAEDCLARAICELSNNPKAYGEPGNKFAQSLLKFRQSKHPKVKPYIEAMNLGIKTKNFEQCHSTYRRCAYSIPEVISVGNKLFRTN